MASETNIPVHHLSYLINEHYRMNYNEFVNKKRVEFVIRAAKEGKWANYSVEGIAHEVGFKSKTTFINSFKKITGTTPSKYLFNNQDEKSKNL
ncbi:MAG: helix-turn-helix domain-containing protein [Bacteroidota bacterium]